MYWILSTKRLVTRSAVTITNALTARDIRTAWWGMPFRMIVHGECSVFSPRLMEVFRKVRPQFEKMATAK